MRILLRIYLDALMKGNPIAVAITLIAVIGLSVGPFHKGLSSGDPAAITLTVCVGVMFLIVIAVAIIDRRLNPKKKQPPARAKRR